MTEVKMPVLLGTDTSGNQLAEESMLHPQKGVLKLQMTGVSEATLTLEDRAETIPMRRWVKIWNTLGFVGYFRRTSRGRNIGTDNSYTLRHGIDILQDSIWDAETTFEGTKTQFLTALLDKQTQLIQGPEDNAPRKPWVIGTCEDTGNITKDIKYDNLLDLMEGMAEEGGGYYFTYNQSVWPWQVSLVAKPNTVASEFRLDRNIERCQIKDNDAELCTRLVLNINKMVKDNDLSDLTGDGTDVDQNSSTYKTYNNTTAQAAYGIIIKTDDIDVASDAEADAWAADYLARRAAPQLQVEIDGEMLKGITGDDWDESRIGTLVRVALPDYPNATISERCVTVTYPDLYAIPEKVTVSLANALPTFTKTVKSTQATVKRQGRSGRGVAREAKSFDQHFKITDKTGDVLKQAGMHLDGDGLLVYADDNVNMVGARFNVQADKIGMVVGENDDGNFIKAAEISVSINKQGSLAYINADHIKIGEEGSMVELSTVLSLYSGMLWAKGDLYVTNPTGGSGSGKLTATSIHIGTTGTRSLTFDAGHGETAVSIDRAMANEMNKTTQLRVKVVNSGNDYKILYLPIGVSSYAATPTYSSHTGWLDAGDFSRAVASWTKGWSNGALTITANPQNQSIVTTLYKGTESWSGTTVTIPINAMFSGDSTLYSTGKSVSATYTGPTGSDADDVRLGSIVFSSSADVNWQTMTNAIAGKPSGTWVRFKATISGGTGEKTYAFQLP